jgi:hypothetical protein
VLVLAGVDVLALALGGADTVADQPNDAAHSCWRSLKHIARRWKQSLKDHA